MALRFRRSVVKVELDNRERGQVSGSLWLLNRDEPVMLDLSGNCLRDIAGCHVVLSNPRPAADDERVDAIETEQEGVVGDMTASRKARVLDCPPDEALALGDAGKPVPSHISNCVYLEWFSDGNGRVVVEGADFVVESLSPPAWRMTREDEELQVQENIEAIRDWMGQLTATRRSFADDDEDDEDRDMDEFEWERGLRESDAIADKYAAVREKYRNHPDRERMIARDMGWQWLEDAMDADERGVFGEDEDEDDAGELPPLNPNPLTEGRDWIRTGDGHVTHPLSHRALEFAVGMWKRCKERDLLGEEGDDDLHEMIFQAETLSVKLAGALDGLAYDERPEGGFVVACLKRALRFFEGSLAAARRVEAKRLLPRSELDRFRTELFAIREDMLRIMKHFRERMR